MDLVSLTAYTNFFSLSINREPHFNNLSLFTTSFRIEGSLDLLIPLESKFIVDQLWRFLGDELYHRFLGNGMKCNNCKTVYPTGVLYCSRCGSYEVYLNGKIEMENYLYITAMHTSLTTEDLILVSLDTYFPEGLNVKSGFKWYSDGLFSITGTPSHWLCQYCGLFVDRDRITCPGCGGNHLSPKEVASIERQCIYCFKLIRGGFACPDCAGRLRPLLN